MIGLEAAVMTTLHGTIKAAIQEQGMDIPTALAFGTLNVARALEIEGRKGSIQPGLDADILLLDEDLNINTVMARGNVMMRGGEVLVKGTFEA
jgi:beta-aspartyl-dipeptidase (metallo-type)